MKEIVAGQTLTYFPGNQTEEDNLHFDVEVLAVGAGKVKVKFQDGHESWVGRQRLLDEMSLIGGAP